MGWRNTELLEVPHMWMWSFRDEFHLFICGRALSQPKVFCRIHIFFINKITSPPTKIPCLCHLICLLPCCCQPICGPPCFQGGNPLCYLVPPTTATLEAGGPPLCCSAVSDKIPPPLPRVGAATALLLRVSDGVPPPSNAVVANDTFAVSTDQVPWGPPGVPGPSSLVVGGFPPPRHC